MFVCVCFGEGDKRFATTPRDINIKTKGNAASGGQTKMQRSSVTVMRLDKNRNECIRGYTKVSRFGVKVRDCWLRCLEGEKCQDNAKNGTTLQAKREKSKRRYKGGIKKDMLVICVRVMDMLQRTNKKQKIHNGNPLHDKPEEQEEDKPRYSKQH